MTMAYIWSQIFNYQAKQEIVHHTSVVQGAGPGVTTKKKEAFPFPGLLQET